MKLRAGSNTIISILGAAIILISVNYLSMRHYAHSDWTGAQIYTLSDKSIKMLRTLSADVKLFMLWSQADHRFGDVKELLSRYEAQTKHLQIEVIDPDLNQDKLELVMNRYGAKLRDIGGGMMAIEASVIATSGDNVKFISAADFEDFGQDPFGGQPSSEEVSGYRAEQAISSAILSVTSETQSKICFTQGHDEWPFEGFGGRGLDHVKEALVQDGYKVEAFTTLGASRIPPACDLVAVVGPERAFSEDESNMLKNYLKRGGDLLLLLDPLLENDSFLPTGLEQLAAEYGIKLGRDIILETDPRHLVSPSPFMFTASEFTSHDSVKQLALPSSVGEEVKKEVGAYPVVFSTARSLSLKADSSTIADELARSSSDSWGEVDLTSLSAQDAVPKKDSLDIGGPAILAAAAELAAGSGKDESGRLVIVGDSDFLKQEFYVNASLANRDFWSGLVGWLTARRDLISIAPKNPEHVRLNLTAEDMGNVWQVVIGEIVFVLVIGVLVWLRRRS